jgi:hypothetical protein
MVQLLVNKLVERSEVLFQYFARETDDGLEYPVICELKFDMYQGINYDVGGCW